MNIPLIEFWASELIFFVIATVSALIIISFYKAKGDGKLKSMIIELFLAKVWVYGGLGTYYLIIKRDGFNALSPAWMLLILNFPMMIVMVRFWNFVRRSKK